MEFGFSEPEGALGGALALEDTGSGFEPAAAEGVVGGEVSDSMGVEGAEGGRAVEWKGLEGPLALGQKRR